MAALPFSADQIADLPQTLFAWSLVAGKLRRELRFVDFVETFGFMARVALIAEAASG